MSTITEPVTNTRHSLDPVVRPDVIAVIGCSRKPGTIGYQIVDNLLEHGYTGALHLVNPNVRAVHSIPTKASVLDIEGPVDLAVITVPKELVLGVAEQCGQKGVRAMVVITAGFKEIGPAGAERERALRDVARRYGMRLVGPNCLGVLNTDPDVSMNATFAPVMPPPGPVSFMSQSGAMGVTILDYAAEYGIGINQFISVGNKADISGNDLIQYWGQDPATRVILMYLENFGNPQKFARIAREVTRTKPIIAVKSGRTASGARAASSHTGALAGLDSAIDALLTQYGVIRVDTVMDLFDLAMAFSLLPLPQGDRVAIITNAGGPGIIIADACEAAGLTIAELSSETQRALRSYLPEEASVRNPVDMIASATADHYRRALIEVLNDDTVDGAIAAFVPPLGVSQRDVAAAIVEARRTCPGKPILAVLMGREGLPQGRAELKEVGVPAYIFPESAARALAAMVRYSGWVQRPAGTIARYEDMRDDVIGGIIRAQRNAGGGYLSADDARTVLRAAGIPVVESRRATTAEEAVAAATTLGLPVVLKVLSPDIVHKTDVGGVELDLRTTDDVRSAFERIVERVRVNAPDAEIEGVQVEQYVRGGRETIIGTSVDPAFGPVLMFGLGGIHVEALRDVVFRVHPLTDSDAREMTHEIRGVRLLDGIRGEPPADRDVLADVIQRVSQLVGNHPDIVELDVNPFVVFEAGGIAVDARIRVDEE